MLRMVSRREPGIIPRGVPSSEKWTGVLLEWSLCPSIPAAVVATPFGVDDEHCSLFSSLESTVLWCFSVRLELMR